MTSKIGGMAFAAVLLVSVVGQAGAVKIVPPDTSNPNRVVLNRGVEDSTTDARLDKKITLKMENKRLPDVLAEVSKQTGVDIHADREARFWAVRQRKVTVFAKDMPLREFMRELKRLLGYHIRTGGKDNEPSYIVWQDLKGRKIEQDMLDAQKREKERSAYETISDAKRALSMSPEEIEWAKKSDPWLAYLATDPEAKLFCKILSVMSPKDLMKDEGLTMSPTQKEAAAQIVAYATSPEGEWRFSGYGEDWKSRYGGFDTSVMSLHCRMSDPDDPSSTHLGNLELLVGVKDYAHSFTVLKAADFNISPSSARSREAFLFRKAQEGMTKQEAQSSYYKECDRLRKEGYGDDDINHLLRGEPVDPKRLADKEAKDPTLAESYKLEPDTKKLRQSPFCATLEELAKTTNCNVMYEYFPVSVPNYRTDGKEEKLISILDNMSKASGLEWEKEGNTIRFRLKDWAERRSWEIPEEWVEAWYQSIKKNNGLSLDEMVDMATSLTDTQIEHNFIDYNYGINHPVPTGSVEDPKVSRLISLAGADSVKRMRSWLELYSRLAESDKKLAQSEEGLPMDNVPQEWWPEILLSDQYPPMYGGVFLFSQKPSPTSAVGKISMGARVNFWLRDFPEEVKASMLSVMPPEQAATVDDKPIKVQLGSVIDCSSPDDLVKKLIEEIERERKEVAAKETTEQ